MNNHTLPASYQLPVATDI